MKTCMYNTQFGSNQNQIKIVLFVSKSTKLNDKHKCYYIRSKRVVLMKFPRETYQEESPFENKKFYQSHSDQLLNSSQTTTNRKTLKTRLQGEAVVQSYIIEGNICINTNNSTVSPSHIVTQGNQKKNKKEQNNQSKETMLSSKDYITEAPCTFF